MKFLRATEESRVYGLRSSDLQMLLIVLSSFPLVTRQQSLSRFGDSVELTEAQKLLEEALRDRQETMRRELETWLKAPDRFRQVEGQLEWRVENERREWLLQILNDVRVGAWLELDSPEDLERIHEQAGGESIRFLALMDMAGMFQTALLFEDASG